jgi:macrocin-O-methyltransferase TylF-like protien
LRDVEPQGVSQERGSLSLRQTLANLGRKLTTDTRELQRLRDSYLSLIESCLTGIIYEDKPLKALGTEVYDASLREVGRDWPSMAHTMIGVKRLANLRRLSEAVIQNKIPGDFIETGVWRGGACILMRAVLKAYGVTDRRVWVADSFQGVPPPDLQHYPADVDSTYHTFEELSVSFETVRRNFEKYGLLDDQVVFLKGWFKDTLPTAPIDRLALLRLDGDLYESTIVALTTLYDRLSPGGYVIVDDYHVVPGCKRAIGDFLASRKITSGLSEIDGVGVFWQKTSLG